MGYASCKSHNYPQLLCMEHLRPALNQSPDSVRRKKAVAPRARVTARGSQLIAYLAILGAALSGYAGLQLWAIAAAAIALASLSYAEHYRLYERANEMGYTSLVDGVLLRSLGNALIATSGAYGLGFVLRVV